MGQTKGEFLRNLDDMQSVVDAWIKGHGGYWGKFQIMARLTEENGEIASALQRQEGLRPRRADVDLGDEVRGDRGRQRVGRVTEYAI